MNEIQDKVSITPKVELKGGEVRFTEEKGFVEYNTEYGWLAIPAVDVPLDDLLLTYEDLLNELSYKEVNLSKLKEDYSSKEFEIVYLSDIDFKALYGSTADVRKQHVKMELGEWDKNIHDLETSINWITRRISFLRELIRCKRTLMECKTE